MQQLFGEFKMLLHFEQLIVFDSFLTHYKGSACMDMSCTYMLSTAIQIALQLHITLFLNLYMSADTATCGTCAAQDHNVYLQENPGYEFVHPMRSKMNVYQ